MMLLDKFIHRDLNSNENIPGIVLANKTNSYLSLAYEKNNSFYSYMRFDKDNIDNITSYSNYYC